MVMSLRTNRQDIIVIGDAHQRIPPGLRNIPTISAGAHLPLDRPLTLLLLALTCHRLYEVVIPHLLYNAVGVVGEELARIR